MASCEKKQSPEAIVKIFELERLSRGLPGQFPAKAEWKFFEFFFDPNLVFTKAIAPSEAAATLCTGAVPLAHDWLRD